MARSTIVITLVVFGLIMALVGGFLQMLCLLCGGLICSGTMTGDFANFFLILGLPVLALGLVQWPFLGKAQVPRKVPLQPAAAARSGRAARKAPECPKCGGPVKPGDRECEWCGVALL